ncbi:hypothetical protein T069G_09854 [Trichoderma breve]|uniref:Uncharacterized protein n=1 Tax=Trichoderma breve TaxID=2034170 RepID=A0A9W9BAX5_9HYPO|nr:hypothetical protein T069G_09854 [Trichoderma breve]KAJ4856486.1 hypothetical protein T069G_09854 [Trichoderma breve]
MHLVQLLLTASLIAATTAAPLLNQEVITETQHRACVYGAPKKYDHWIIHYHEVKPPSQFPMRFILDPAWVARHQNVGDADHFSLGTTWVPWAENRSKHSTPEEGEFSCYFFDALIQPENIVPRAPDEPFKLTHAFNRLCENDTEI